MDEHTPSRRKLIAAIVALPVVAAAFLWFPRWWENRMYRDAEAIAGVGARIVPGRLADSRAKAQAGADAGALAAAIGKPSISVAIEGKDSRREIWTYYFADGTMVVNVTDGVIQRVSADFNPPSIPTSARP